MSFSQYNSGVPTGTGSSRDPVRVGILFLGILSSIVLSIIFVCLIWKAIEVLVERYRRSSLPRQQMEPPDVEGQTEVRRGHLQLTKKFVEMIKRMFSGSAADSRRLNNASSENNGQEQLFAAAAAEEEEEDDDGSNMGALSCNIQGQTAAM